MDFAEIYERFRGKHVVLSMKKEYAGVGKRHEFDVLYVGDGMLECLERQDYFIAEGFPGVFVYPCVTGVLPLLPDDTARMMRVLWGS